MDEGRKAASNARATLRDHQAEGRTAAEADREYKKERARAWAVVSYMKAEGLTEVPEGYGFEAGLVVGALATGEERKAVVEALVADKAFKRDIALNQFRTAKARLETYQSEMTMVMSFLKTERDERQIDAQAGPVQHGDY
jgi:hypothetical protein